MEHTVKQRVVGAVVLVALAVIFIPVFLEGPEEQGAPRDLELPQEMEDLREGRIEPLEPLELPPETVTTVVIEGSGEKTSEAGAVEEPAPMEPQPAVKPEAPEPAAPVADSGPDAAPEAEPEPSPAAAAAPSEAAPKSGWAVQVGAFGSQDNAIALRDRLRKAGFTAYVEKAQLASGTLYRVRIGPEIERADADALLEKLTRETGVKGKVMPHP